MITQRMALLSESHWLLYLHQRLAAVIGKAKAANMTKDRIDAAIKRGTDSKEGNGVGQTKRVLVMGLHVSHDLSLSLSLRVS